MQEMKFLIDLNQFKSASRAISKRFCFFKKGIFYDKLAGHRNYIRIDKKE